MATSNREYQKKQAEAKIFNPDFLRDMQLVKETLSEKKPMSMAEISKRVNLPIARVTEIIDRMWSADMVANSENEKREEAWLRDED